MTSGPKPGAGTVIVAPLETPLDAVVTVPGSKSITNRALLVAALVPSGTSRLDGALVADDVAAMVAALEHLGVALEIDATGTTVTVHGCGGRWPEAEAHLDARQAGTVARFLPPALAAGTGRYRLDGSAQLRGRPLGPLLDAVRQLGVEVRELGRPGRLPVEITGEGVDGWAREVALPGDVSSQFVSGLMMVGPLAPAGLRIRLTTPLVSRPYLGITAAVMAAFGAGADVGDDAVVVPPGRYRAADFAVEPDASAASYFFAAAAVCGGRVRVEGLGERPLQGDAAFVDVLTAMGATVRRGGDWTEVTGPAGGRLRGVDVDLSEISDTAPTLAVVAAFADGPTRVRGIGFVRGKESDRIAAPVAELRRLGVDAAEEADGFVVRPSPGGPRGGRVETYDDHRMAMAFAVAGLRVPGVEIADPGCVAKTFPTFWAVLDGLRRGGAPRKAQPELR